MKKAFTLIELMITMVLGGILLNYTFTYYINFASELEYIKAKEKLAMESFKFTNIVAYGFKFENKNVPGLISYDYKVSHSTHYKDYSFLSHSFEKFELNISSLNYPVIEVQNHTISSGIHSYEDPEDYEYKKIKLDNKNIYSLAHLFGLFSISNNFSIEPEYKNLSMVNPKYTKYQRLVYIK